jgi:hypothetical protein
VHRSLRVPAPVPLPAPRRRARGGRCLLVLLLLLLLALLGAAALLLAQPDAIRFPTWLPTILSSPLGQATEVVAQATATEAATEPPPLPPTETDTPEPSPAPTATETPEPSATPPPPQVRWELELLVRQDNLLFVINRLGEPFPLGRLRLGEGDRTIEGDEWNVARLAQDQCVVAIRLTGRPMLEGAPCQLVGQGVQRRPNEVVWQSEFPVFFEGEQVGICSRSGCQIQIF